MIGALKSMIPKSRSNVLNAIPSLYQEVESILMELLLTQYFVSIRLQVFDNKERKVMKIL